VINFFKQFFIYGLASTLSKVATLFLMPFYTGILTKEEYGAMALIAACKGVIGLFSNLNLHSGITRDYFEEGVDRKKLVSTGFFSILFNATIVFVILFLTSDFWVESILGISGYKLAFVIMLLSIPLGGLDSYLAILTRFKNKPMLYAVGSLIALLMQIAFSVYFVLIIKIGIVGVFLALVISEIFAIIFFLAINWEYFAFTLEISFLKKALLFSLPTLPAIMAGWVDRSLGQVMIGKYISLEDLGVYAVAIQLASVFALIRQAIGNVWNPYVFENYKKKNFNSTIQRLYKIIVVFLIILTINLAFLSKDIVLLFSNSNYLDAYQFLILLCFPMSLYTLLPFVSCGVLISRETKYLSYSYVPGSLVNLLLLFLFLPRYGILVAPISLGISRIINYIILYNYSKKKIAIDYPTWLLGILLLVVVICFFLMKLEINKYLIWCTLGFINILTLHMLNSNYNIISNFRVMFVKNKG